MADRTSAALFGEIFQWLAEIPNDERALEFASRLYERTQHYDFLAYQMDADDALLALGLARKGVRQDYLEDGEVTLFKHEDVDFGSEPTP